MSKKVTSWICTTCGTQYKAAIDPPNNCPICEDERQFVNWNGQEWTTISDLQRSHQNLLKPQGPGLTGIWHQPQIRYRLAGIIGSDEAWQPPLGLHFAHR